MVRERKAHKYWKGLENTISESKKVMEGQGVDTLPSSNKLRELGYSGLSRAISVHHSGFPNFREIMNQELGIKSNEKEESNKITLKPLYSSDFGKK